MHSDTAVATNFNGVWYFPNSIKHNIPEPLEKFSEQRATTRQSGYLEERVWGRGGVLKAKVPSPTPEWLLQSQHQALHYEKC